MSKRRVGRGSKYSDEFKRRLVAESQADGDVDAWSAPEGRADDTSTPELTAQQALRNFWRNFIHARRQATYGPRG